MSRDDTPFSGSCSPEELLAHAGWIRALCRSLVTDPHGADDLAQETWLAALEKEPHPHRSLRAWLGGVVRNLARFQYRADKRRRRRETRAPRP